MSQQANLCYYSNRCEWSKAFMKELAQTPWANSFSFFCVDAEKRKGPLPAWLKKVPTLVINGEQQPRTDGDVMNWLSEMRLKNSGSGQRSGTGPVGSEPEPEGWNTMEHSSFARGFRDGRQRAIYGGIFQKRERLGTRPIAFELRCLPQLAPCNLSQQALREDSP